MRSLNKLLVAAVVVSLVAWFALGTRSSVPLFLGKALGHELDSSSGRALSGPIAKGRADGLLGLGAISGRVVTNTGEPVAGARVCASRALGLGIQTRDRCVRGTEAGRYDFESVSPGEYLLTAGAEGFFAISSPRVRLGPGERATDVNVVLVGGAKRVSGIVLDAYGGPIDGAGITGWSYGRPRGAALSGADGSFELWLPAGLATLSARAEGYALAEAITNAPAAGVEIRLTPESAVSGQVVRPDGTPVGGVEVSSVASDAGVAGVTTSKGDGKFFIGGLSPGRFVLTARGDRIFGRAEQTVVLGIAEVVEDVRIVVRPGFRLAGSVLALPGREPCAGASVTVASTDGYAETAQAVDGVVEFPGLPSGRYTTIADCDAHVPSQEPGVIDHEEDTEDVEWLVDPGLRIGGRVESDGEGIAGATVWATGPRPGNTTTDGEGNFVFAGLLAGEYSVAALVPGYPAPEPETVAVAEGELEPHVVLAVEPGTVLVGTVVEPSGGRVAGVHVTGEDSDVLHGATTLTDANGRFELAGLPVGEVDVFVHVGSNEPIPLHASKTGKVRVQLEPDLENSIELVLSESLGKISGTTADTAGPAPDVYVVASYSASGGTRRAAGDASMKRTVLSDEGGQFQFEGLPGGEYTIEAYRKGGAGYAVARNVKTGTSVDLTLSGACSIMGTIEVAGPMPERFSITATHADSRTSHREFFFDTDGSWTIPDLETGTYDVVGRATGGASESRRVECTSSSSEAVSLRIDAVGGLRGRLVDAETGEGVAKHLIKAGLTGARFASVFDGGAVLTSSDGRFEIEDVPAGRQIVVGAPQAWESAKYPPVRKSVTVVAGETVELPDWKLLALRIPLRERPGDLGFELAPPPEGEDQVEAPLVVGTVTPAGPADIAGVDVGDVITGIDEHDVTGDNWDAYFSLIRVREGTVVRLEVAGKEPLSIRAASPK